MEKLRYSIKFDTIRPYDLNAIYDVDYLKYENFLSDSVSTITQMFIDRGFVMSFMRFTKLKDICEYKWGYPWPYWNCFIVGDSDCKKVFDCGGVSNAVVPETNERILSVDEFFRIYK